MTRVTYTIIAGIVLAHISCKHTNSPEQRIELRKNTNPNVLLLSHGKQFARYSEHGSPSWTGTRHLEISEGSNDLATLKLAFDDHNRLVQIQWFNVLNDTSEPIQQVFEVKDNGKLIEVRSQNDGK